MSATRFKLIAWNIRAGGGTRSTQVAQFLQAQHPDVIVLSEFRATAPSQQLANALAAAGFVHQSSTADPRFPARNALLIASHSPLSRLRLHRQPDEPGRWRVVRQQNPGVVIGAMHVPNQYTGRKPQFHASVLGMMQRWRHGPAIFAGDTNSGCIGIDEETRVFNLRTTQWFDEINAAGWRDAFRLLHGNKREFTWFSPGHDNGFRLDQAFVSPDLVERVRSVEHVWVGHESNPKRRDAVSDHAALVLELDLPG